MSENNEQLEFNFDERPTIKGYPELRWTSKKPYKSTQYYPAQLKESYGKENNEWMNKIFWGDNLQVMSHLLKNYRGKVDMIYIDPPFDSKADYKKKITLKSNKKKVGTDNTSFEEKQYADIWNRDTYLQFMFERLILIRELMSAKGVIALHCDWHKSHHLRMLMDEVFGADNFINEIIWKYSTGGIPETFFAQKHDTIFIYSKNQKKYDFNKEAASYPRNECQECGAILDKWNNLKKNYDENGRIYRTIKSSGKIYKYYDDEPVLLSDVWLDISHIQQKDPQRTNYPTQKPEKLLERIIKTFTQKGDIVFDCFMGSGTTLDVSMKLGRKFIGADINLGSIQTTTNRLLKTMNELENSNKDIFTGFEIYNVNNYDFFRNPIEAKEILITAFEIQKYPNESIWDGELDGRKVKIMPVNRIATKADLKGIVSHLPFKKYEQLKEQSPNLPVEKITLICMGHEPDLKGSFKQELSQYNIDIEIVDIMRDKKNLLLKRDAEAVVFKEKDELIIQAFYPMNLLQKLSLQKENVDDWKQLVDSIMIDWNYDGAIMQPTIVDVPNKNELVQGKYIIPKDAGKIKIKITDILSESLELEV